MSHITNVMSRVFEKIATTKFPKSMQSFINKTYVKRFEIDMSEFDFVENYETLNKLFTRSLTVKRKFKKDSKLLYAMSDSWISECGEITDSLKALQIKGFSYSVEELLGKETCKEKVEKLNGGVYANLYLSPADYHHYHAPCDMKILKATHIPGKLYPVNLTWLNKKSSLFVENERVILECETKEKAEFFLVYVGALNVGKINFLFDKNISTNVKRKEKTIYTYKNLNVKQCDELGYFDMGSTVLFFGEKGKFALRTKQGKKVKYNDLLAEIL